MYRRELLAAVGTATPLVGGCLSRSADPTIQLGYLDVGNFDTASHRFDVRVFRDGKRVHDSSHEVRARDDVVHGTAVECTWDETPGTYTVSARVDGGEWAEQPLTADDSPIASDTECVVIGVWYRNDEVTFTVSTGCDRDYDDMCSFAGT